MTFSIECKRESVPAVLALLGEMLREPTFPAGEFDVLKRQVRDSLEEGRTDPQALGFRTLQRKLSPYPEDDVRYVPTIEESVKRLEAVTVDQVRKLYEDQLGGAAGELVAVGDLDPAAALKQMDEILKGWKAQTPYARIERPAVAGVKGERLVIETPDKANAVYLAGLTFPMTDADPDDPALEVADFVFGSGTLSSRLGVRVRQKEGLSYGVRSQFSADSLDPSAHFQIYAICNPKNIDKVDASVLDETEKLRKEGAGVKEVEEAKKAYLAAQKVARGSDGAVASELKQLLYAGRTFEYEIDLEKKIDALTAEAGVGGVPQVHRPGEAGDRGGGRLQEEGGGGEMTGRRRGRGTSFSLYPGRGAGFSFDRGGGYETVAGHSGSDPAVASRQQLLGDRAAEATSALSPGVSGGRLRAAAAGGEDPARPSGWAAGRRAIQDRSHHAPGRSALGRITSRENTRH